MSETGTKDVIMVDDLHMSFGSVEVLRGVNFVVSAGSVISVIGRSGGGKSTLLRCLSLLTIPKSGRIMIGGRAVFDGKALLRGRQLAELRQNVGMVFQDFQLFPHLTAGENVMLPLLQVRHMDPQSACELAVDLLGQVGMADRGLSYPRQLSGGQQQRVAIARALALNPLALLFDEPTSALDPESTVDVLNVMRRLGESGITMMVVTHELSFARDASSNIVFMDGGVIVEEGNPEQILKDARDPRTRSFVQAFS